MAPYLPHIKAWFKTDRRKLVARMAAQDRHKKSLVDIPPWWDAWIGVVCLVAFLFLHWLFV